MRHDTALAAVIPVDEYLRCVLTLAHTFLAVNPVADGGIERQQSLDGGAGAMDMGSEAMAMTVPLSQHVLIGYRMSRSVWPAYLKIGYSSMA